MRKYLNINENNVAVCIEKLDLEKFSCYSFESTSSYDLVRVENLILKELDSVIKAQVEKAEEDILLWLYKITHRRTYNKGLLITLGNIPFRLEYADYMINICMGEYDMQEIYNTVIPKNIFDYGLIEYMNFILQELNTLCVDYSDDNILTLGGDS